MAFGRPENVAFSAEDSEITGGVSTPSGAAFLPVQTHPSLGPGQRWGLRLPAQHRPGKPRLVSPEMQALEGTGGEAWDL